MDPVDPIPLETTRALLARVDEDLAGLAQGDPRRPELETEKAELEKLIAKLGARP